MIDLLQTIPQRPRLIELGKRALGARCTLGGLSGSSGALALAAIAEAMPLFVVVPDVQAGEAFEDDLETLAPKLTVRLLRPASELFHVRKERDLDADDDDSDAIDFSVAHARVRAELDAESRVDISERVAQLAALENPRAGEIYLVPAAVLLERQPVRETQDQLPLELRVGARFAPRELDGKLRAAGFKPTALVGSPGECSLRGDILDVFPYGERNPIRVEFFDDSIESIRMFDAETQLSIATRTTFSVSLVRPDRIGNSPTRDSLLHDRLPSSILRVFSEPSRSADRVEESSFAHQLPAARTKRVRSFLIDPPGLALSAVRVDGGNDSNLETLTVEGVGGGIDALEDSLAALRRHCDRVIVLCESDGERNRMAHLLGDRGLADQIDLQVGHLRGGFQLVESRIALLNELELLGKTRLHRPRPRKSTVPVRSVTTLLELQPGDYLVHQTHGVARFNGMQRMKRDQGEEDFLVLEFDGGTTFYLPAAKIDLVQRYVGPSGAPPRLDKIGGRSWASKKAKVTEALEEMAGELLEVQAARQERPGAPHPHDEVLIAEFERSFPWTDTLDQARACVEIHGDMSSRRPMDRLICGDVGFGKTELAVRATFRAVLGGRQVAVLVPTTLLAEQHFSTFERRFATFPVKLAVLSRFRSRTEQKDTVKAIAEGAVDIVIGTHRLLSKDIAFKDLGLLVVDEEHRFGVKAKETLKRLKASTDVLTLSATPIPRTLHMSLIGLRDISALATPPAGRRPVRTEIHRDDDRFLRKILLHEIDRGGQAFFVHNRIASLEAVATRIANLVPTARVVIGHGQMDEDELDDTIRKFSRGEADVLVSTSIIESGLDLPRANTMIVDRPEWFGLADLHQMRGRVGRADIQAYCYLLVRDADLPEDSQRRLKAIEEMSHLGAGYDIAIKDLEIRGAGDLLSGSQSGHISAVGYDLFCRLLAAAIARAKGEKPAAPPLDVDVDLGVVAFLPAEYVPDPGQRMEILRRLGGADSATIDALREELRDRFGRIPEPAQSLLYLFALKRRCQSLGIRRLLYPGEDHCLLDLADARRFHRDSPFTAKEAAVLTNGMIHVRLPHRIRDPERTLDYLVERMLKPFRTRNERKQDPK